MKRYINFFYQAMRGKQQEMLIDDLKRIIHDKVGLNWSQTETSGSKKKPKHYKKIPMSKRSIEKVVTGFGGLMAFAKEKLLSQPEKELEAMLTSMETNFQLYSEIFGGLKPGCCEYSFEEMSGKIKTFQR